MAIDEAVLVAADSGRSAPTLRFYGWSPPAVSLGYFQDFSREVNVENCRALGIDIVRRPTGGKAVLHEREITYSVVSPRDNPLFPDNILETYKVISSCLVNALVSMGIDACIAGSSRHQSESSMLKSVCFSEPSRFELLVSGKKICGSAQVRTKHAFLQHGSLLLYFEPERAIQALCLDPAPDLKKELARSVTSLNECMKAPGLSEMEVVEILAGSFRRVLNISLKKGGLTPGEEAEKRRLTKEKYSTGDWNVKAELPF